MKDYNTIWEDFVLPSKGLIYDKPIDPNVSLRSMTTAEEMKRMSYTNTPYKTMSDIIQDCLKEKLDIPVCDLSLGDYQFLLHKLRIVTYGPEYKMTVTCPKCNNTMEITTNLEDLPINEYKEEVIENLRITLPVTKDEITLKFQTPHDLDLISFKTKEKNKKEKSNTDYTLLFMLMSQIKEVNGLEMDWDSLINYVEGLPMRDANFIAKKASMLNEKVGVGTLLPITCAQCGFETVVPFRVTSEFFGPTD